MLVGRSKSEIQERSRLIRASFARTIMPEVREELFNKQSGKCFWCLKDLSGWDSVSSQLDHYTSVYMFAERRDLTDAEAVQLANAKANFVLAHPECNKVKNALDADEFREHMDSGKIVLGDSKKWTVEEIEKEKQRLSAIGSKNGRIGGRKTVESGQLDRIRKLPQTKKAQSETGRIVGCKNVESGQLASLRTSEHQRNAGRIGGHVGGRK